MALGITCNNPPHGEIGLAGYTHAFPVTGDTPPDVWAITVGTLPAGLTLAVDTGVVSGTPTGPAGTSTFTIQVTDSTLATASVECSITIDAALNFDCGTPPHGQVGIAYSHLFPATGGDTPYAFAITLGSLPDGLALGAATGIVSGTPTLAGVFPFAIRVTDNLAATITINCSITIDPLSLSCGNPPDGQVRVAYSHTFPVVGGIAPLVFDIASGTLPGGLSLNSSTGVVSGTPTTKGTFPFAIRVTDDDDNTETVNCSIRIVGKCLVDTA